MQVDFGELFPQVDFCVSVRRPGNYAELVQNRFVDFPNQNVRVANFRYKPLRVGNYVCRGTLKPGDMPFIRPLSMLSIASRTHEG